MRKLHISIGLALLLLTAQLGAVLHEVSHICRVGTNVQTKLNPDTSFEKVCELCVGFSQVANPVGSSATTRQFEPASAATSSIGSRTAASVEILTPRSRGPPSSAVTGPTGLV